MTAAEREFAELELTWVRQVRKTRNGQMLHLVEPAVRRERELIQMLNAVDTNQLQLLAAEPATKYGD